MKLGDERPADRRPPPLGPIRRPSDALTRRELEVLALLATGASTGEMALRLEITPSTVRRHLANAYRKLGTNDPVDAVRRYLLSDLG